MNSFVGAAKKEERNLPLGLQFEILLLILPPAGKLA